MAAWCKVGNPVADRGTVYASVGGIPGAVRIRYLDDVTTDALQVSMTVGEAEKLVGELQRAIVALSGSRPRMAAATK